MMPDSVFVPLATPLAYTIAATPDNTAKINAVESTKSLTFLSSQITSLFSQISRGIVALLRGFSELDPILFQIWLGEI
jgi:hypothetical protein